MYRSPAYERAPIYIYIHYSYDIISDIFLNVNNNGSMYKLKKIGEITPPCFTPYTLDFGL